MPCRTRNLHGIRCTLPDGAGTITGDSLDPNLLLQPGRERSRLLIGQQVDDLAALQVGQASPALWPRHHARPPTDKMRGAGGVGAPPGQAAEWILIVMAHPLIAVLSAVGASDEPRAIQPTCTTATVAWCSCGRRADLGRAARSGPAAGT